MGYVRKDHFYKRAKQERKASRAVYKLSEIQARYKLIEKGATVIDLGCAPGSWMHELSDIVGPKGKVIGIDVLSLKIELPKNCQFINGDISDEATIGKLNDLIGRNVDAVLSDMSPNLSGVAFADTYKSYELSMTALTLARSILKKGGGFIVKMFPGEEFKSFMAELKKSFKEVNPITPQATRKTSSERYLVARGYKGS
ncbi:MAG: RlmE family RNA methyltransferase [Pseudomonadota bacterium]